MSRLLFDGVFNFIETYLRGIGNSLKNLDILFYVFVGLELLFVIYFIIKSHFAYEFRLIRAVDKINIYLLNNSYVNENNLIEFNKKMKRVPKTLRYHWQQYMLYREHAPSHYMSSNNCIEKPLRSSSLTYNVKTMRTLTTIFAVVSLMLGTAVLGLAASQSSFISPVLFRISIVPTLVILIGGIYSILQSGRQMTNLSDLYQTFHIFQRLIDKAVTTIPDYVDFEVLFTKKEIAKGIPALNEYLEKRARQEQEELEKARKNAIEHEVYDFGSVDISGSLILDRAMKETEIYLSLRNRLLGDIQRTETEIDTLKKAYDNTQREYQRKLQASQENVNRLRLQQEASTNRIETNYLRKQLDDEIKKQVNLEKENTDTTIRFNQDVEVLAEEIKKKKEELEERRKYVEEAMLAEYKTYSTKVFKNLAKLANEKNKEEHAGLLSTKDQYAKEIVDLKDEIQELTFENEELKNRLRNFDGGLVTSRTIDLSEPEEVQQEEVEETLPEEEVIRPEVSYIPEPEVEEEEEEIVEEEAQPVVESVIPSPFENEEEEPPYDEFGGYYDSEGYYRYANGTYYDPDGNFHDGTGGYYDPDGNYHEPEVQEEAQEEEAVEEQAEVQEEVAEVATEENVAPVEEAAVVEEPATQEAQTPETIEEFFQEDNLNEVDAETAEETVEFVEAEEEEVQEDELEYEEDEDEYLEDDEDYEDEEVEVAPQRKPGRPKKEVEPAKRKPGRPKKEEPKKRPGRPRKEEEEVEVKKGPGRPKKEESHKGPGRPAGSTKSTAASSEKRSVGRPKKEEVRGPGRPKKEEVRGPGRPKKEEVRGPGRPKKEEKRGPGRPKKEEKRGPGRPKKEEKRGPGRPAKKKSPGRPKKS